MTKELQQCYEAVFQDLLTNGPNLFKGVYDARHGNSVFMFGIETVMEYIAIRVDDETYEKFSELFTKNMVKSEEKA